MILGGKKALQASHKDLVEEVGVLCDNIFIDEYTGDYGFLIGSGPSIIAVHKTLTRARTIEKG